MANSADPNDEFLRLLSEHEGQIYGLLFALICHREDAEDVMQQVVVKMWQKFGDFEPGTNFGAWGCAIAKNRALNYFQSRNRRTVFSQSLIELLEDTRAQQPATLRSARRQALRDCLDKLPGDDRELITARYQSGVEIKKVAQELGRPAASVYNSLRRIRQALYKCIEATMAQEGHV